MKTDRVIEMMLVIHNSACTWDALTGSREQEAGLQEQEAGLKENYLHRTSQDSRRKQVSVVFIGQGMMKQRRSLALWDQATGYKLHKQKCFSKHILA